MASVLTQTERNICSYSMDALFMPDVVQVISKPDVFLALLNHMTTSTFTVW